MKTKSILISIAILANVKLTKAQDTIQLRNKTISIGHVKEITDLEVKFNKVDNPNGPVYILSKYDVESVKYQNGAIENFEYVAPWLRQHSGLSEFLNVNDSAQAKHVNQLIAQRITNSNQDNSSEIANSGIPLKRNNFSLNNKEINGNRLHKYLLAQHNPIIDMNVKKAKNYRVQSYLGFMAIPMAAMGAYYLFSNANLSSTSERINMDNQRGIVSLFASAMTLSYSIRVNSLRTKHLQKAVDAYNENRTEKRLENHLSAYTVNKWENSNIPPIQILNARQFIYQGELKNEYQMQEIMLKKHDPVIQQKIEASRRGKLLRYLAFADIPITVAGFAILADALDTHKTGTSLNQKQILSSAFLVAGSACFTIGIYHAAAYKKNTRKAALRYNQLYNN